MADEEVKSEDELGTEILDRKGQVNNEQPGILSQMDSSINVNKSFVSKEEEAGLMPYPTETQASYTCLRYLCCITSAYSEPPLLGPQRPEKYGKKCLVLDLDETLVHSSFQRTDKAHYQIPLELEEGERTKHFEVFVIKRPSVDEFLAAVAPHYEIIVFTASIERYAQPLLELLDSNGVIDAQLYRESCTEYRGSYVKDLKRLGRDMRSVIIVDNSPAAYQFQPENAIPCLTFVDNMNDRELDYCKDFLLSDAVLQAEDVRTVLDTYSYHELEDDI